MHAHWKEWISSAYHHHKQMGMKHTKNMTFLAAGGLKVHHFFRQVTNMELEEKQRSIQNWNEYC